MIGDRERSSKVGSTCVSSEVVELFEPFGLVGSESSGDEVAGLLDVIKCTFLLNFQRLRYPETAVLINPLKSICDGNQAD